LYPGSGVHGEFADRVHMGFYEAGHMMDIHMPSLLKLKADLAGFIRRASGKWGTGAVPG